MFKNMTKIRTKVLLNLVLWHINHYRLFNAKSFLYMYNKYKTSKHILKKTFLNEHVLNVFNYRILIRIILFIINHLFAHS